MAHITQAQGILRKRQFPRSRMISGRTVAYLTCHHLMPTARPFFMALDVAQSAIGRILSILRGERGDLGNGVGTVMTKESEGRIDEHSPKAKEGKASSDEDEEESNDVLRHNASHHLHFLMREMRIRAHVIVARPGLGSTGFPAPAYGELRMYIIPVVNKMQPLEKFTNLQGYPLSSDP